MEVLEQTISPVEAVERPAERPVFLAETSRRPRLLRIGGRTASVMMGAWLIALVVGAFGFGYLPGIPLLGGGRGATARSGNAAVSGRRAGAGIVRAPAAAKAAAHRSGGASGAGRAGAARSLQPGAASGLHPLGGGGARQGGAPGFPAATTNPSPRGSAIGAPAPPGVAPTTAHTGAPATAAPNPRHGSASSPPHGGTPPGAYHSNAGGGSATSGSQGTSATTTRKNTVAATRATR